MVISFVESVCFFCHFVVKRFGRKFCLVLPKVFVFRLISKFSSIFEVDKTHFDICTCVA